MASNTIPSDAIIICGLSAADVSELESTDSDFHAGSRKLISRWDMVCELRAAGVAVSEIRGEPLDVEGHELTWTRCAWRLDGNAVVSIDDIICRIDG